MWPKELTQAVHDNLRNLGLDVLDVVNLPHRLEQRHAQANRARARHLPHRLRAEPLQPCASGRRRVDRRPGSGRHRLRAVFPLGGFTPLQSTGLSDVARRLDATPMQVASAWLLQRAPNILLIPGTSSVGHLRENLAAAKLELTADTVAVLDQIGAAATPA